VIAADYYTQAEGARILSVDDETFAKARDKELLAVRPDGSYDKKYIDQLRDLLTHAKEEFGGVYTELHTLQYQHSQLPQKRREETPGYTRIVRRLHDLAEGGVIIDLHALAERIPGVVKYSTSYSWVRRRKVAAVKIGNKCYLSSVVAERFESMHASIVEKRSPCISVPEDTIAGWVDYKSVAASLGVGAEMLRLELAGGRAIGTKHKSHWLVSPQEIERWRRYFSTINPGFEWLQRLYDGQRPPALSLMNARSVVRGLGNERAASVWPRENLLPFFLNGLTTKLPPRVFVRPYIVGLARFAGRKPVKKRDALWYAELCALKGKIV
jgi:hypothetical protein